MEYMEKNNRYRNVKNGDIVWVDLIGKGSEQQNKRPCLVVSNNISNRFSATVDVIPFTSRDKVELPVHVLIRKSEQNGLKKDSVLLVEQKRTVDKRYLDGKIGRLEDEYNQEIAMAMLVQTPILQSVLNTLDETKIEELKKYTI